MRSTDTFGMSFCKEITHFGLVIFTQPFKIKEKKIDLTLCLLI